VLRGSHATGLDVDQRQPTITLGTLIIDDHARDNGLLRYALDPVQIQHMGFTSQLDPSRPLSQAVWSMAFEDLEEETLEKEHDRMVRELYGNEN